MKKILVSGGNGRFATELKKIKTDLNFLYLSKKQFNIPTNSPKAGELREHYYGKWTHLDVWKERWGFDYMDRSTFELVKSEYKDTLLWDFYHHDPENGPLKSFDI